MILIILVNVFFVFSNFRILNKLKENNVSYSNIIADPIKEFNLTYDPLSLSGFTEVYLAVKGNDILLGNNCTELVIASNEYQVYSIEQGLKSKIDIRPTTHDIMSNVLNNFNISLLQSKIVENLGVHYFARTVYKQGDKILNIDTKASDAVALAVRMNVPVFVKNDILYNHGKKVC